MQLAVWAHEPTAMQALDLGWRGWVLSLFAVGVTISGIRDGIAACRIARRVPIANPFAGQPPGNVLVTGGTGFVGETLVNHLLDAGMRSRCWRAIRCARPTSFTAACAASRPSSSCSRTSVSTRSSISRGAGARCTLEQAPAGGAAGQPRRRDGIADALGRDRRGQAAHVDPGIGDRLLRRARCRPAARRRQQRRQRLHVEAVPAMGQSARPLERHGVRSVVLRLGVVFGPGGALRSMLLPHYFGMGGRFGDGAQVMSWIHRDDVLRIIARAMANSHARRLQRGRARTADPARVRAGRVEGAASSGLAARAGRAAARRDGRDGRAAAGRPARDAGAAASGRIHVPVPDGRARAA